VIAFLIIIYSAVVLLLFKVQHIKPTAYLIASMIVVGVFTQPPYRTTTIRLRYA
jgi:membrane fusion protein, multidrug efflux system